MILAKPRFVVDVGGNDRLHHVPVLVGRAGKLPLKLLGGGSCRRSVRCSACMRWSSDSRPAPCFRPMPAGPRASRRSSCCWWPCCRSAPACRPGRPRRRRRKAASGRTSACRGRSPRPRRPSRGSSRRRTTPASPRASAAPAAGGGRRRAAGKRRSESKDAFIEVATGLVSLAWLDRLKGRVQRFRQTEQRRHHERVRAADGNADKRARGCAVGPSSRIRPRRQVPTLTLMLELLRLHMPGRSLLTTF